MTSALRVVAPINPALLATSVDRIATERFILGEIERLPQCAEIDKDNKLKWAKSLAKSALAAYSDRQAAYAAIGEILRDLATVSPGDAASIHVGSARGNPSNLYGFFRRKLMIDPPPALEPRKARARMVSSLNPIIVNAVGRPVRADSDPLPWLSKTGVKQMCPGLPWATDRLDLICVNSSGGSAPTYDLIDVKSPNDPGVREIRSGAGFSEEWHARLAYRAAFRPVERLFSCVINIESWSVDIFEAARDHGLEAAVTSLAASAWQHVLEGGSPEFLRQGLHIQGETGSDYSRSSLLRSAEIKRAGEQFLAARRLQIAAGEEVTEARNRLSDLLSEAQPGTRSVAGLHMAVRAVTDPQAMRSALVSLGLDPSKAMEPGDVKGDLLLSRIKGLQLRHYDDHDAFYAAIADLIERPPTQARFNVGLALDLVKSSGFDPALVERGATRRDLTIHFAEDPISRVQIAGAAARAETHVAQVLSDTTHSQGASEPTALNQTQDSTRIAPAETCDPRQDDDPSP